MKVAYDASVFVAADRNDRGAWADHRVRLEGGIVPITTAPVVAQVSRSPCQVQLRRFLRGCEVVNFERDDAHRVGLLLGAAGSSDVVDAHLALVAESSEAVVLTSDSNDLRQLSIHLRYPLTIQSFRPTKP